MTALMLVALIAAPAMAQARPHENKMLPQEVQHEGREVAAPSWSAACMTDHGSSQCDEPMWVYGSATNLAHYRNAF
jgi:hypothetical protein